MDSKRSLTEGKILPALTGFALPVLLALFLQTAYGAVDLWVVSKYAADFDISAVSTGSWLMYMVTTFVVGVSMGTTVLLGRHIGEKRGDEAGRVVGASVVLFLILGVAITAVMQLFAVPLDACAEMCRITHQTAWEWRHRLFAAVDGYQDRIVLRGRAWIDETHVNDTDLSKGYGQARKRGLSKQKICIAVGIDSRKEPVAVVCGHGKPSSARIWKAMGAHVAKGATLVHDRERAHNVLVRENGLVDESYKADVRDPAYLEAMRS